MTRNKKKPLGRNGLELQHRHAMTDAYQSDDKSLGFSDISEGFYRSAIHLHREAKVGKIPNISVLIPSSIALYCFALDAYINSVLGRLHLVTNRPELIQHCYDVAVTTLDRKKVEKLAELLQLDNNLFDEVLLANLSRLKNLRDVIVHSLPLPNPRNFWREHVLEAAQAANIPLDRFPILDSQSALCCVEFADWSKELVDQVYAIIQGQFKGSIKWPTDPYDL